MTDPISLDHLRLLLRAHESESSDSIAKKVLAELGGKIGGKPFRVRSLGNEITKLRTDKPSARGWWSRRPEVVQALHKVLSANVTASTELVRKIWKFTEFPELRAMDLSTESIADLGFTEWFSHSAESRWIEAPRGAGCSLIAQLYRHARAAVVVVAEKSLQDVEGEILQHRADVRVVVDLRATVSHADLAASERLARRGQVIVLAHSPPPTRPSKLSGATSRVIHSDGGPVLFRDDPETALWNHIPWRPADGWRLALLQWVHARLVSDNPSSHPLWLPAEMANALDQADPSCVRFDSPGTILSLLATLRSKTNLSLFLQAMRTDSLAEQYIEAAYFSASRMQKTETVARANNLSAMVQTAIMCALLDRRRPWSGVLECADIEQAEAQHAPRTERTVRKSKAKASVKSVDRTRLKNLAHWVSPDQCVVGPRWIMEVLAIIAIEKELKSGAALDVLALGGVQDRRKLVDLALQRLAGDELCRLTLKVCAAPNRDDYVVVAARETLFAAWAKKHERKEKCRCSCRQTLLTQLVTQWKRTSRQLNPQPEGTAERAWVPTPMTRAGALGIYGDGNDWIADCWSWSLFAGIERPDELPTVAWLFPGWDAPTESDLSETLSAQINQPHWPTYNMKAVRIDHFWDSDGFKRLASLGGAVLDRVKLAEGEELAVALASPLVVATITDAKWRARVKSAEVIRDVRRLCGLGWLALQGVPIADKAEVAQWIWSLFAPSKVLSSSPGTTIDRVFAALKTDDGSPVLGLVLKHLPAEVLWQEFVRLGVSDELVFPHAVFTEELLSKWVDHWARWALEHGSKTDAERLVRSGIKPADDLLMRCALKESVWCPSLLWRERPDLALQATRLAADDVVGTWFAHGVNTHSKELLLIARERFVANAPTWMPAWLSVVIQSQPTVASEAVELLHKIRDDLSIQTILER
jgi:hypothetical protein